jgi:hypothetical protein
MSGPNPSEFVELPSQTADDSYIYLCEKPNMRSDLAVEGYCRDACTIGRAILR